MTIKELDALAARSVDLTPAEAGAEFKRLRELWESHVTEQRAFRYRWSATERALCLRAGVPFEEKPKGVRPLVFRICRKTTGEFMQDCRGVIELGKFFDRKWASALNKLFLTLRSRHPSEPSKWSHDTKGYTVSIVEDSTLTPAPEPATLPEP